MQAPPTHFPSHLTGRDTCACMTQCLDFQKDPGLKTTCRVTGEFDPSFKCWVAPGITCNSVTYVGQGSVCQDSNDRSLVFRCQAGKWVDVEGG